MTATRVSASGNVWQAIDNEKRRDRIIRNVSVVSWCITFLLVLALSAILVSQTIFVATRMRGVGVGWQLALPLMMPLVISLGVLSVLIATLSTVAIFLRLRTASLNEIQLRLASLEEMIVARTDSTK
jgi:uncharacterized membrane protein YhaH (DUF805 family)